MTDRCREVRMAALQRLIEDAEASRISDCSVEEICAEARALTDECRRRARERSKKEVFTFAGHLTDPS